MHHLLLINHDAVSLGKNGFSQGVRVLNSFTAVLARNKAWNQTHGPGSEQGIQNDQVFEPRRLGIAQHGLHAPAFKLKHRFGFAFGKQGVCFFVVQR